MNVISRWIRTSRYKREYIKWHPQLHPDAGLEPLSKVEFHAKMLDEFLLRLLGFLRLEDIDENSAQSFIDNALFLTVEAASQVADEDLYRLRGAESEQIRQTWQTFKESLAALRTSHHFKTEAEETYRKLSLFTRAVAMDKIMRPDAYPALKRRALKIQLPMRPKKHLRLLIPALPTDKFDPTAEVHYEWETDALVWRDEFPFAAFDADKVSCLRAIRRYRTSLICGARDRKFEPLWSWLKRKCPQWIGFRPERCTPSNELLEKYMTLKRRELGG